MHSALFGYVNDLTLLTLTEVWVLGGQIMGK
jgi:hypothetical protein